MVQNVSTAAQIQDGFIDTDGSWKPWSVAQPLPVTGTITTGGTLATNITQIASVSIVTGGVGGSQSVGGPTASGVSFAANPLPGGGRAQNVEASAVSNAQVVAAAFDLVGRAITWPYANKENILGGKVAQSGTTAGTLVAAQAAGVKFYATSIVISNSGTNNSEILLNDGDATLMPAPATGGVAMTFPVPLVFPAATAVTATPVAASGTITTTIHGFKGT